MRSQRFLRKKLVSKAAAGVLALAAATQVSALPIVTLTNPNSFSFGLAPAAVPIAAGVFQTPVFFNLANQRFIVSYTAECVVDAVAGDTRTFVDLTIRAVNVGTGVVTVLAPTAGASDAFCSANGTDLIDGWAMHTVNAIGGVNLPAGNYRVEVLARLSGPGTGTLDDSTLIVWR